MKNYFSLHKTLVRGLLIPVVVITGCTQTDTSPTSGVAPLMEGVQTVQSNDGINPYAISFEGDRLGSTTNIGIMNVATSLMNFPKHESGKICSSLGSNKTDCPLNQSQTQKVLSLYLGSGTENHEPPTYQGFELIESFKEYEKSKTFVVYGITYERTHDEKNIVLQQNNANFVFISDHEYINSGKQIIIKDNGNPVIIMLKSKHTITTIGDDVASAYENTYDKNTVLSITPKNASQFFSSQIILPQGNNTMFEYLFGKFSEKDIRYAEATVDVPLDTQFTLLLKGYQRSSFPSIQAELLNENGKKAGSLSFSQSGTNAIAQVKNLTRNTKYTIQISYPGQLEKFTKIHFTTRHIFETKVNKNIIQHPVGSTGNKTGYQGVWNGYYGYNTITDEYNNNYHLCFSQPLDEEKSRIALEKTLGSGSFSLAFSKNNESYDYERNKNTCMMFYYYLNPEKSHQFEIKGITSLYGESTATKITIPPYTPASHHTFVTIAGNMINILPTNGALGSTLQINYKNIKKTDLYLRSCKLSNDMKKITENLKIQDKNQNDVQEMIHAFLECGSTQKQAFTFSQFQRRRSKVENIDLKKLFGNALPKIFQVGVSEFKEGTSKVFIRTNIGILTKTSKDNLHIWLYELDTGKPITNAKLSRGTLSGELWANETKTLTEKNYEVLPWKGKIGYLKVQTSNDETILVISDPRVEREASEGKRVSLKNNFGIDPYQIGGAQMRWQNDGRRIFGYSDRVLYKSEDRVFVSGRVRKPGTQTKPTGSVSIELRGPEGQSMETQTVKTLDAFGGYTAQFQLSKNPKLGTYQITSIYSDPKNPENSTQYTSYFQVQEYKKSNIALNDKLIEHKGEHYLSIRPEYYFGGALEEYNITMNYTLQGRSYGIVDRSACGNNWCDQPLVYNYIRGQEDTKNGSSSLSNYKKPSIDIPLKEIEVGSISTLNIDTQLTDTRTSETVNKFITTKVYPRFLVGLKGYEYHRSDLATAKNYTLEGKVLQLRTTDKIDLENYEPVKAGTQKVKLLIYFKPYSTAQEKGPDEQRYFANGEEFKLIQEKEIGLSSDGTFKQALTLDKVGKYFIRTQYDKSETQKTMLIRESNGYMYPFFGDISNNYKLNIHVDAKEYKDGENVQVNVEPYIKGAQSILTVEKDGQILYQAQKVLDGKPLTFKANRERYPNAHVSVTQIVGEQVNAKISTERKEPRFFIGYTNVKLSPESMKINYDVKITDLQGNKKSIFAPGQEIKVTIVTKDYQGRPLASRVTAGIVDKALLDIYDEIRKPLEAIYQFSQAGISITTNLKNLYLALKVFSQDGTKGGGGGGGNGGPVNPGAPRKDFFDIAFRRGALLSSPQGSVEFTTKLPDNLTTRTLDLIAVGAKGEMGVHRSTFKVAKEIMIQANLPRFLGMYDRIAIPVTLINNSTLTGAQLSGYIRVGNTSKPIQFYTFEEKTYFDISMQDFPGHELIQSDLATVGLEVRGKDYVIQDIPLRKENSFITKYRSSEKKKDTATISLTPISQQGVATITVAKLPIEVVNNALYYLLRYPYGCTEQLLSSVYPLIIAQNAQVKTLLSPKMLSGTKVFLNGKREESKLIIEDALTRILKNQKVNGLLGYRPSDDDGSYFNYELSVYGYQVLGMANKQGYAIDMNAFKKLESALSTAKSTPTQLLQFFLTQSLLGKTVNTAKVEELVKASKNAGDKVLGYTILAMNNNRKQIREKDIENYLEKTTPYGGEYISHNAIQAYYVRGLIKNGQLSKALQILLHLRKQVNNQGTRGRSTQENIQVILAFTDYFKAIKNEGKQISFTLNVLGKSFKEVLDENETSQTITLPFEKNESIKVEIDASEAILSDLNIRYLPADLTSFKDESKNATVMLQTTKGESLSRILSRSPLGSKHTLKALFKVTQKAHQVAVVIPIPASTFIVNPDLSQNQNTNTDRYYYGYDDNNKFLKFTNTEKSDQRYSCRPTYYEVRFDQLFLYYEQLQSGAGCQVEFDIIKTHQGQIPFLQMQLFEMYYAQTRAKSFIKL